MSVSETIIERFRHRLEDYLRHADGNIGAKLMRILRSVVYLHHGNRHRAVSHKRQLAGHHFIKHYADRIDIRRIGSFLASRLLGADIVNRADSLVRYCNGRHIRRFCDAEISDLDLTVVQKHYILRFNITVDNTLAVCMFKCAEYLKRIIARFFPWELALFVHVFL